MGHNKSRLSLLGSCHHLLQNTLNLLPLFPATTIYGCGQEPAEVCPGLRSEGHPVFSGFSSTTSSVLSLQFGPLLATCPLEPEGSLKIHTAVCHYTPESVISLKVQIIDVCSSRYCLPTTPTCPSSSFSASPIPLSVLTFLWGHQGHPELPGHPHPS